MKLKINFPDHVEALEVVPEGEHFRVRQHSFFLPLSPGDIVSAEDGVITGIVDQQPVFMVEVFFTIDTAPEVVREHAAVWRQATDVTQPTALTLLISSRSHQWITDEVAPRAWWVDLKRAPGAPINFSQEVAQA